VTVRLSVTGPGGTSQDSVAVSVIEPCPAVLDATSCLDASKASLSVDERRPGREKLNAKWTGMTTATERADFGDPVNGDSCYSLCLYADKVLAGEFSVDRVGDYCGGAPCWRYSRSGWGYKDGAATANGIRVLKIKPGSDTKGSVKVLGQNNTARGLTSLPTGIATVLSAATDVAMQLRVDDGVCVSTQMSYATARESLRYSGGM
jgi:hypothetical protein